MEQLKDFNFQLPTVCSLCGGTSFSSLEVLWQELIDEWKLSSFEEKYINYQQGFICQSCNSNLRIMTLAQQILNYYNYKGSFEMFINTNTFSELKILEINDAGALKMFIDFSDNYRFTEFSELGHLKLPDNAFDVVIHSDVLEHLVDPVIGLKECYRVLNDEGILFYTVPLLVDRPSINRKGLPKSYHLPNSDDDSTQLVHTEFGHDFWKVLFEAGFTQIQLSTIMYPCSIAISAKK